MTTAPVDNAIALFSKDGLKWSDSTPIDWRQNPNVTKIVIGTPGADRDDDEHDNDVEGISVEIPTDLAIRFENLTHLHLGTLPDWRRCPISRRA